MQPDPQAALDAIIDLAMRIGSRSPDCAEEARQIASLAGTLRQGRVDKGALRDALTSATAGNELSDADLSATVDEAVRDAPER